MTPPAAQEMFSQSIVIILCDIIARTAAISRRNGSSSFHWRQAECSLGLGHLDKGEWGPHINLSNFLTCRHLAGLAY